jgi:hypothetical protein
MEHPTPPNKASTFYSSKPVCQPLSTRLVSRNDMHISTGPSLQATTQLAHPAAYSPTFAKIDVILTAQQVIEELLCHLCAYHDIHRKEDSFCNSEQNCKSSATSAIFLASTFPSLHSASFILTIRIEVSLEKLQQ